MYLYLIRFDVISIELLNLKYGQSASEAERQTVIPSYD